MKPFINLVSNRAAISVLLVYRTILATNSKEQFSGPTPQAVFPSHSSNTDSYFTSSTSPGSSQDTTQNGSRFHLQKEIGNSNLSTLGTSTRRQPSLNTRDRVTNQFSLRASQGSEFEIRVDSLSSESQVLTTAGAGTVSDSDLFSREIILNEQSMLNCLKTGASWRYMAKSMEIHLRHLAKVPQPSEAINKNSKLSCEVEMIVPEDMVVKIQVVQLQSQCHKAGRVRVIEIHQLATLVDICSTAQVAGEFSLSSRVTTRLVVNEYLQCSNDDGWPLPFVLHLNLTAVAPINELQMFHIGPKHGVVQTPRWDGHVYYPRSMNSKVVIRVPEKHSVMFSYLRVQLGLDNQLDDIVRLYKAVPMDDGLVALAPVHELRGNDYAPEPQVLDVLALHLLFRSDGKVQSEGFKAYFSFHSLSERPYRTARGGWNCSVPYWPDFRLHFSCNLIADCVDREDEVECPYGSQSCGKGVISAGDGCYLLLKSKWPATNYRTMQKQCQLHGGYLASLNTKHEWDETWGVLERYATWERVVVGLQPPPSSRPDMYSDLFYWADGSVAYFLILTDPLPTLNCAYFKGYWTVPVLSTGTRECFLEYADKHFLCEVSWATRPLSSSSKAVHFSLPHLSPNTQHVTCPAGHVTHTFLACDVNSKCWRTRSWSSSFSCHVPLTTFPPHFYCADGVGDLPYTLVCDHRKDCLDNSDEGFCVFPACPQPENFLCDNGQCVPSHKVCDGQKRCLDDSHPGECHQQSPRNIKTASPPAQISMNQRGKLIVVDIPNSSLSNSSTVCPETHFQCDMDSYYCLPVYLRCNDVKDCPGHEDEAHCHDYTCEGFYRCRGSWACVHPNQLCDGLFQCPQHDDEFLCEFWCPENCSCYGFAWTCAVPIQASMQPALRYLDARGTMLTFADVAKNTMLIYLNLASCGLTSFLDVKFPNLHILDLSGNFIRSINSSRLRGLQNLNILILSGNRLSSIFTTSNHSTIPTLHTLDLSKSLIPSLDVAKLNIFPNLQTLNLSVSDLDSVTGPGFQLLPRLRVLDVRGCPLTLFPKDLFKGLQELQVVYADNYKLCCPAMLPVVFSVANCHAKSDEISTCDTLLRSDFFRLFLYVFAAMALFGNSSSFVYRAAVSKAKNNQGFGVFVTHLCVSDFLMGVYLTGIGVADRMYQGSYLWEDVKWRNSVACKAAGFLSLLSCEVSAFIICLITADRFLVLRFPFKQLRFSKNSARIACFLVWVVGAVLALVPLLPITRHWEFYSQNSICLPLPVTRRYYHGFPYSFGVMIILNSFVFLLIALGQAFIYHSITINSINTFDISKSSSKDLTIARRLVTIAMSDFLCWFPVGFVGLLASQNVPIPGEVNVGMAIFVLPLNSALNPFLYTLNIIWERRRRAQFNRLQILFKSQMQAKQLQSGNTVQPT